ncbi:MAG: RNA polymerase factor sigma-54 [Tannerella sp.]|jgi:RNA polymerase sigma-54 factor|nr:RNA polymerase factor sigma-54 [Tannerella sp.]
MFGQRLQQKLQQRMSPQQIQYVRLLELPAMEMDDRVKQELEENPALEEGLDISRDEEGDENTFDTEEPEISGANEADLSLGDYLTEDDIPDYKLAQISSQAERKEEIPFSTGPSLHEHLEEQLGLQNLSEQQQRIGEYIIGNIDDDGYLRRDIEAITDDLIFRAGESVSEAAVRSVLSVIQDFDPIGVAARNLRECLLLQLEHKSRTPETEYAIGILKNHFDAFVRKHYEKIQKAMNLDEDSLKRIFHEITSLNPKPGNSWNSGTDTRLNQIIPDFVVEENNGELTLSMNRRSVPDLHISPEYTAMFQDYMGNKANRSGQMKEAVQFVKQKLDSAQWFIDALRQRYETLQRTMQTIILLQRDFFLSGDESKLHPMILKDVAEHSGYDISTISRVSNSKYVQTNFGVYPLKFFFSESTQNESGEEISTREVRQIMRETVDAEDKHKPVTDEELTALLKKKGYLIARRTVAKYREQMNIPVARLRKEL